jgi:acetyl-CoA carboxylase biotin carboxyl carrier protein
MVESRTEPSSAITTAAAPSPSATEASAPPEEAGLVYVTSPIVGTFYRSPSPDAGPFVGVGDSVDSGTVLCIVEAMRLMNEIEAEQAGEIVSVFVENGHPVEYGERLFAMRPR